MRFAVVAVALAVSVVPGVVTAQTADSLVIGQRVRVQVATNRARWRPVYSWLDR
jgi:hypothetical protein